MQIQKTLQTPHIANRAGKNRAKIPDQKRPNLKIPDPHAGASGKGSSNSGLSVNTAGNTESAKTTLPQVPPAGGSGPVVSQAPYNPLPPGVLSPRAAEAFQKLYMAAKEVRRAVEKNCDDVGTEFAEEARKIHYGETEQRGIYGRVTPRDAEDLIDEGIAISPLPPVPKADS